LGISVAAGHVGPPGGPVLCALARRAPYFHNGSAQDLAAVVNFYDEPFEMASPNRRSAT